MSTSDSSYTALNALSGSFLAISTIVVGLRIWCRRMAQVGLWADDWTMLIAWLMYLGMASSIFFGAQHKIYGWQLSPEESKHVSSKLGAQIDRALEVFMALNNGFVKASALFFFQRIFCLSAGRGRGKGYLSKFFVWTWILLVITLLWTLAFIFLPVFQCGTHFDAAWTSSIHHMYCGSTAVTYAISQTISDFVLDLIILVTPIPKIWALKTRPGRKVSISLIFLTGTVSIASAIARLPILYSVFKGKASGLDIQIANSEGYFFWMLEAGFAMVAVNMPSVAYLRTKKAPERILESVRSKLSLMSLRSAGSSNNVRSDSSKVVPAVEESNQGVAEHSQSSLYLESKEDAENANNTHGGIKVMTTIHQEETHV